MAQVGAETRSLVVRLGPSPGGLFLRLFLLSVILLALPGCRGCWWWARPKTPEEIEAERAKALAELKKKKEKKPDYQVGPLMVAPFSLRREAAEKSQETPVGRPTVPFKRGHWSTGTFFAKTNNFDHVLGDLRFKVLAGSKPMELLGSPFAMTVTRQVALQKGQLKGLELQFFIPPHRKTGLADLRIDPRRGTTVGVVDSESMMSMQSHQYHFAVFARMPEQYVYLQSLDSVKHPGEYAPEPTYGYYRVVLLDPPAKNQPVRLPPHALYWTTIAYFLWDNADPDQLSPEQKTALVDWLHWGGQLIISGPETLDTLRGSFLAPYLPATAEGTRQLEAADFAELNARWVRGRLGAPLAAVRPWSGVKLKLHSGAREVPGTGGLVVERRVGKGRILTSAFRLSEREFRNWPNLDGFFNGCLLGRMSRRFYEPDGGLSAYVTWDGSPISIVSSMEPYRTAIHDAALDPERVTKLRYFGRDTGRRAVKPEGDSPVDAFGLDSASGEWNTDVGSWCDYNEVADTARGMLQDAARIEIPDRSFVLWVLGVYLVVLVPVNWAFFRLIGRVEWAWVAAPIIALVCAGAVIHMARLDIGFARSQTEIGIVELQGEYSRAHLTRYTALYTSLATEYAFRSADAGTQVLPFPVGDDSAASRFGVTELTYRFGEGVEVDGFQVSSNTTAFAHAEQMIPLGGPLRLTSGRDGAEQLVNGTKYPLSGVGIVRMLGPNQPRGAPGGQSDHEVEIAWVGSVESGGVARLKFARRIVSAKDSGSGIVSLFQSERRRLATAAGVSLQRMCALAERPALMEPGEVRLVGWVEGPLPGLTVRPAAPQARHVNVLLAHLRYPHAPEPQVDVNTRADVDVNTPSGRMPTIQ